MIGKLPLVPGRLRRIPPGFGWVDHRLLRDGHLRRCSPDVPALYLVLLTAADRQGLSHYVDALLCYSHGRRYQSPGRGRLHRSPRYRLG